MVGSNRLRVVESDTSAAESWPQRIEKRKRAIEDVKATPLYQAYARAVPNDQRPTVAPQTPIPDDTSISKRAWEFQMQQWRSGLRAHDLGSDAYLLQGEHRRSGESEHNTASQRLRSRSPMGIYVRQALRR